MKVSRTTFSRYALLLPARAVSSDAQLESGVLEVRVRTPGDGDAERPLTWSEARRVLEQNEVACCRSVCHCHIAGRGTVRLAVHAGCPEIHPCFGRRWV